MPHSVSTAPEFVFIWISVLRAVSQIQARVQEAIEPTSGVRQWHVPLIKEELADIRAEILADNKPLSRITLVTSDEDLLAVLGDSEERMQAPGGGPGAPTEETSLNM